MKARINHIEVEAEPGTTILDAALRAQVQIPVLCKHPDLPPIGACGLCVVKIAGRGGMVRACCTPIEPGMDIVTHDAELAQVRRTVLKLILSNHPNECLTCGRNGTCELQKVAADFGIRHEGFPEIVPDLPKDRSTRSIVLEPRKCIKCGRCITVCQDKQNVWALSFLERGLHTRMAPAGDIQLADSPCIRCGQCSAHCPTGAIFEYNQTEEVWDMLMDPDAYCIAQVAPAVRVSVGEPFGMEPGTVLTGKLYAALRRMGFDAVFDTNFGADVTVMEEASEFVQRFGRGGDSLPLITTCCPSWVDFMEKFHHDMIDHFSSCKSPHAILGTLAKTYYAEKMGIDPKRIRMVSIMPCTAKKFEISRSAEMFASGLQDVDVSLTTRELYRMIRQAGIAFEALPDEPADSPLGDYSGAGTIFGATGGVMEAALRTAAFLITGRNPETIQWEQLHTLDGVKHTEIEIGGKKIRAAVAHGLAYVEQVLDTVRRAKEKGEELPYHFIEVMACPGGCIGGGGQTWGITDAVRRKRIAGLMADDRQCEKRFSHENQAVKKVYDEFLGEPLGEKAHHYLHTRYTARPEYRR